MNVFRRNAALAMVLVLALLPALVIFADSHSYYDSFYSLAYGHTGSAHYTSYSSRYGTATSITYVYNYGRNVYTASPGATAYSSVDAPSFAAHTHTYY